MNTAATMLRAELRDAILGYNMNRAQLVEEANRQGGPAAAARLEDEFVALCNADLALAKAQLNESHPQYDALVSEATDCALQLKHDLIGLETFSTVLDAMALTVTVIGRLLLMAAA